MATKRKAPSSTPSATRERYDKWKKRKNTKKGKLDFYYCNIEDKTELFQKANLIKSCMGDGNANTVTTFEMLFRLMDFYINMNCREDDDNIPQGAFSASPEYRFASQADGLSDELFVCTLSSLQHLISQAEKHARSCEEDLECQKKQKLHHVLMANGTCSKDHKFTWSSSPFIPGGKYLVNVKMAHAYFTSGMLPNHLE